MDPKSQAPYEVTSIIIIVCQTFSYQMGQNTILRLKFFRYRSEMMNK